MTAVVRAGAAAEAAAAGTGPHGTPPATPSSSPSPRRWRGRRILAAVGVAALLIVGILLTWGGIDQAAGGRPSASGGARGAGDAAAVPGSGNDGYFTTSAATLRTSSSALMTREIEVGADGGYPSNPSFDVGDLARLRIRATTRPGQHVFIGIASVSDVRRYLAGTAYDEMQSFRSDPFSVTYHRWPGTHRPAAPAAQHFWVARASGTGKIELQWNKRGGAWAAVAMNADGRPGVVVTADVGLRFPGLLPAGVTTSALGVLGGIALVRRFVSVPRRGR